MVLYHAATVQVRQPRIIQAERGRDFGFGFYVTPDKDQAERWARQSAAILARQAPQAVKAIVNIYRYNPEEDHLKHQDFARINADWLALVTTCRTQDNYAHACDIISGPIADEAVGAVVTKAAYHRLTPEAALEQLAEQNPPSQWAFCTPEAIAQLKFQSHYELETDHD
ncbi:DUF3990 domain-containing protein [bacterium]|nr:DUF3990 domain-containing protein [bacterium]